ncbi:hypothetical protein C8Q80DRAFT_1269653 [Daedaleopsis nitida]|nr:hypothetical protein C8Q80DRAFT_1269653 [Daedaleopsis nitida]
MSVSVISVAHFGLRSSSAPSGLLRVCGDGTSPRRVQSKARSGDKSRNVLVLAALNGDVVHEIVSYLCGPDALNLSLCARRLHDFAIHRVASRLSCRTPDDLRRYHEHLLEGPLTRAIFLRSLSIVGSTFIERSWQDDPNWVFPETTYEYTLAALVGDILEAAQGLTHLMLEHFASLAEHDSRIRQVIASMPRLNSLELCQIDPGSLTLFQTLRSHLRHVRLSTVKTAVPSEAKRMLDFVHELLAAISHMKELRALDLDLSAIRCCPFKVPVELRDVLTPLPHVRRLSIHWHFQLLDVASLFPNLNVYEQPINTYPLEKSSSAALRRLSITELQAGTESSPNHQPVHLLHLRRYPQDAALIHRTVLETSPVGLSMHGFIDAPQWIKLWETLLRDTAPRLKFLDVHCHTWDKRPVGGWVTRFIESLRGSSLICMRIIAPHPPAPSSANDTDAARWLDEDLLALAELPDRVARAIPTLRYVAWAAKRRASEYEWHEGGHDCACAEYKWYRVVSERPSAGEGTAREGWGRKLVGITAGEGERVRCFLLEADADAIGNIDAHLFRTMSGGALDC